MNSNESNNTHNASQRLGTGRPRRTRRPPRARPSHRLRRIRDDPPRCVVHVHTHEGSGGLRYRVEPSNQQGSIGVTILIDTTPFQESEPTSNRGGCSGSRTSNLEHDSDEGSSVASGDYAEGYQQIENSDGGNRRMLSRGTINNNIAGVGTAFVRDRIVPSNASSNGSDKSVSLSDMLAPLHQYNLHVINTAMASNLGSYFVERAPGYAAVGGEEEDTFGVEAYIDLSSRRAPEAAALGGQNAAGVEFWLPSAGLNLRVFGDSEEEG